MARKKRKREKPERSSEPGDWSSTSFAEAEERGETAVEESTPSAEAFPSERPASVEQAEAESASAPEREVEPAMQPAPAPTSGGQT